MFPKTMGTPQSSVTATNTVAGKNAADDHPNKNTVLHFNTANAICRNYHLLCTDPKLGPLLKGDEICFAIFVTEHSLLLFASSFSQSFCYISISSALAHYKLWKYRYEIQRSGSQKIFDSVSRDCQTD